MKRRITGVCLAMGLLSGSWQTVLAQSTVDQAASSPAPIAIRVECDSSPERVTITNNRVKPVIVKRVGSAYQRRAGEPYRARKTLRPGKSVTFTFGTGKGGKRLSGSFIFDNDAPGEGVVVVTSAGRVKADCIAGSNKLPLLEATTPVGISVEPVAGEPIDALELLATLAVEPEIEPGYEREAFQHWVDEDGDGCDTREEVLILESLTPVLIGDGCSVEAGTWLSAADGDRITNPASVDINHVVPLKEAWQSGAHAWSPERREAFANDLSDGRTLQAVSAGVNRQQGENDPSAWLPADRDVACQFVVDWVAIKATWGLAVDGLERDALEATLTGCHGEMVTVAPR